MAVAGGAVEDAAVWRTERNRSGQRGRGLHQARSGVAAAAGRAGQTIHPAARLSSGARPVGSRDRGTDGHRLRRQRPHVRPRGQGLHAGRGRGGRARPRGTHLAARRRQRRRRLREALRLRRQAGLPAVRDAVRREQRADDGDRRRRSVEVHRHEQRRGRRQEGVLRRRIRPVRQRRAPAGVPDLDDGQLAVQHGQCVPRALDAARRAAGADRIERRAVGCDAGQRREDVVPGGRQRDARLFPVPGRLRQLQRARSIRDRPADSMGRAGSHCGHARRDAVGPHA